MASVASDTSAVQMIMPPSRPDSAVPGDPSSGFADVLDTAAGIAPASPASADAGAPSAEDGAVPANAVPPVPPAAAQIALLLQAAANLPGATTPATSDPATTPASPPSPAPPSSGVTPIALLPQDSTAPATLDTEAKAAGCTPPAKSDKPDKSDKTTDNTGTGAPVVAPDPTLVVTAIAVAVAVPPPATPPPSPTSPAPAATAPAIQTIAANVAAGQTAPLVPATSDLPNPASGPAAQTNNAPAVANNDDADVDAAIMTVAPARTAAPTQKPADAIAATAKPNTAAENAPETPSNGGQPPANASRTTPDLSANNPLPTNPVGSAPARAAAAQTDDAATPPALTGAPESKQNAAGNSASSNPASNPNALTPAAQQQPFATLIAPAPVHGAPASAPAVPIAGVAVEIAARVQDGQKRFEIRLDPPDLGRIEVRLDVDTSGRVVTHVTTDRSDTLDLMRRDAPSLERALQSAGLTTDNGTLQFSLRQQAFAGSEQTFQSAAPTAHLTVPDSDGAPLDAALRRYGQLMGLGAGIDIRV